MAGQPQQPATQLLQALRSVMSQIAKPSQVLKTILGQAVSQTGANRGVFAEVDESGDISYRVLYKYDRSDLASDVGRFSRSIYAHALKEKKAVRVHNAMDDPQFRGEQSIQSLHLKSILCMPIRIEGRFAAIVHLEHDEPGHFKEKHEQLLQSLIEIAEPVLGALTAGEGVLQERDALRQAESAAREELLQRRESMAREWTFSRFIGKSPQVRELEDSVAKAAETDFPVLLLGETGTGKSILARVLHHTGPRVKNSFVTVFCPSLDKGMVETELFGHKRGAFTGAVTDRVGKVQVAEKGTLFLDELGELPIEIQPRLLRLLQERTFERVGDPKETTADVRLIAATNRDLVEEVREKRFRRDLYERLNYLPIRVPPLRERRQDIPLLLLHCLRQHDSGRWIEISEEAMEFLCKLDFAWPGNVRHLEQLAARLAISQPSAPVTPEDMLRLLDRGDEELDSGETQATPAAGVDLEAGLPTLLAHAEKQWILEALRRHPNLKRSELAAKLKISEAALYKKLRRYELSG